MAIAAVDASIERKTDLAMIVAIAIRMAKYTFVYRNHLNDKYDTIQYDVSQ